MSRLRITEGQAKLFGYPGRAKKTAAKRIQRAKEDLPENQVEQQIIQFLQLRGWLVKRNQVGTFVPYYEVANGARGERHSVIRVGEKGEADFTAQRPVQGKPALVESFYFEAKAPGEVPKPHQKLWMDKKRATGFTAEYFDGLDRRDAFTRKPLMEWYEARFER